MEFNAFAFFMALINFIIMFYLFYLIVIVPMEDAVKVRQKRVQVRLDEIRGTLASAQGLEEEVATQFGRLEDDKREMAEAAQREIERVSARIQEQAERDAEHLVAKTRREADKNRQETLAALNRQLAGQAMEEVQRMLQRAFDSQAQEASASTVLGKVGSRG